MKIEQGTPYPKSETKINQPKKNEFEKSNPFPQKKYKNHPKEKRIYVDKNNNEIEITELPPGEIIRDKQCIGGNKNAYEKILPLGSKKHYGKHRKKINLDDYDKIRDSGHYQGKYGKWTSDSNHQ